MCCPRLRDDEANEVKRDRHRLRGGGGDRGDDIPRQNFTAANSEPTADTEPCPQLLANIKLANATRATPTSLALPQPRQNRVVVPSKHQDLDVVDSQDSG